MNQKIAWIKNPSKQFSVKLVTNKTIWLDFTVYACDEFSQSDGNL